MFDNKGYMRYRGPAVVLLKSFFHFFFVLFHPFTSSFSCFFVLLVSLPAGLLALSLGAFSGRASDLLRLGGAHPLLVTFWGSTTPLAFWNASTLFMSSMRSAPM